MVLKKGSDLILVKSSLLSILKTEKLLTDEQIKNISISKENKSIVKSVLMHDVSFLSLTKVLNQYCNIKYCSLLDEKIDLLAIKKVDYDFAQKNKIFPFKITEDSIFVAMENPLDKTIIDDLQMITSLNIVPLISKEEDIKNFISNYYIKEKINVISNQFLIDEDNKNLKFSIKKQEIEPTLNAPTVKLIDYLLETAITLNASDIHIEPFENIIRTRFRIDGRLREVETIRISFLEKIISRLKIMSNLDIGEKRLPQEGHFKLETDKLKVDFRVSTVPTIFGEKAVIRIFYTKGKSYNLNELGFFEEDIKKIEMILRSPFGAILLTGPTGSGKTTTLYSFLNILNKGDSNIVTIEDPVENHIFGITQININKKAGLDFNNILEHILRQDPDTVMIGEIRNKQTADLAIRASITGHLVLSTLHTNDSISTIIRLINMGIEEYLIASGIKTIIAQRLVRKLCKHCKVEKKTNDIESKLLNVSNKTTFFAPQGCNRCSNTGYKGRFAVYEILIFDDKIISLVEKKAPQEEIKKYLVSKNFNFIKDCIIKNILLGETSLNELIQISE